MSSGVRTPLLSYEERQDTEYHHTTTEGMDPPISEM